MFELKREGIDDDMVQKVWTEIQVVLVLLLHRWLLVHGSSSLTLRSISRVMTQHNFNVSQPRCNHYPSFPKGVTSHDNDTRGHTNRVPGMVTTDTRSALSGCLFTHGLATTLASSPPIDPTTTATRNVFRSSSQMEHLVLMVKHHDPVGSHTDRVLGMVIVDTATALQAPGISTQEWFPVRKGPGMKAGHVPQGKVHVKVRRVSRERSGGRGDDQQLVKAWTTACWIIVCIHDDH